MINYADESFSSQEKEFGDFLLRNAGKIDSRESETLARTGALLFRAWSRGIYSINVAETDIALLAKCQGVFARAAEHRVALAVGDELNNVSLYRYFHLENFIGKALCEQQELQFVAIDFCDAESVIENLLGELPARTVVVMPDHRNADFLLAKFPETEIRRFSELKRAKATISAISDRAMLISDCEQLTPEILAHFLKQHDNSAPLILCGDPDNSVIPGGSHHYFASFFNAGSICRVNLKKSNPILDEVKICSTSDKIEFAPYSSLKDALISSRSELDRQLVVFPHQSGPLSAEAIAKHVFPGDESNQQTFSANAMTWRQLKKSDQKAIKIILPRRDYDFLDFDRIQLMLNPVRESVQVYGDTEIWRLAASRKIPVYSRTADICKKSIQELY